MKKYILLIFAVTILFSCDDFLNRVPKTEITESDYFNTITDLETYCNSLYTQLSSPYTDLGSDNISINTGTNTTDGIMSGNITSATVGGWDNWKDLRSVNFFLENAYRANGGLAEINHFVGIAKFFRAQFYFSKVRDYSDVPWYNKSLQTNDNDLYKPCDPRALVVDSILADLEFAVKHVKPALGTKTRISKWSALALMARFCLYEGTYRKYHSELNLTNDHLRFLDKAIWACEEVKKGDFSISGNSVTDYVNLFCSPKLHDNPEIILCKEYDAALGVGNNSHSVLAWQWSLSRSLMESFLMNDGTPFTSIPNYETKTFLEIFENRDPRLSATIAYPGFKSKVNEEPHIPSPLFGCYDQLKFYPRDESLMAGWDRDYTSLPVFRLGEILLIEAEALAEKGTITQPDLDKTINKLRVRVGMPELQMSVANSNIDPVQDKYYPGVTGANKGLILEIRRERRVEMSCEGLRVSDLKRWAAGVRFADAQQGMYIPHTGAFDMTGDGIPDLAILKDPSDTAPLEGLTEEQVKKLVKRYLKDKDGADEGFYLSNGSSGYIGFTAYVKNPRKFEDPMYYYCPIPKGEIQLNPALKQPFGWK